VSWIAKPIRVGLQWLPHVFLTVYPVINRVWEKFYRDGAKLHEAQHEGSLYEGADDRGEDSARAYAEQGGDNSDSHLEVAAGTDDSFGD